MWLHSAGLTDALRYSAVPTSRGQSFGHLAGVKVSGGIRSGIVTVTSSGSLNALGLSHTNRNSRFDSYFQGPSSQIWISFFSLVLWTPQKNKQSNFWGGGMCHSVSETQKITFGSQLSTMLEVTFHQVGPRVWTQVVRPGSTGNTLSFLSLPRESRVAHGSWWWNSLTFSHSCLRLANCGPPVWSFRP